MGKLIFEYSSMNAGKTSKLLQTAFNYIENNFNVLLLKPSLDNRTGNLISSRIGLEKECFLIDSHISILNKFNNFFKKNKTDVILVDEAQFLSPSQVYELRNLTIDLNLTVICYGLRTTFEGKPFEASSILLSLADKLNENITICTLCSKEGITKKASMTLKYDSKGKIVRHSDTIIDTGFENKYTSVCYKHWYLNMKED